MYRVTPQQLLSSPISMSKLEEIRKMESISALMFRGSSLNYVVTFPLIDKPHKPEKLCVSGEGNVKVSSLIITASRIIYFYRIYRSSTKPCFDRKGDRMGEKLEGSSSPQQLGIIAKKVGDLRIRSDSNLVYINRC